MLAAKEAVDPVTKQVETFQDSFTVGGGKSGAWYVQAVNSIQSSAQEEAILKTGRSLTGNDNKTIRSKINSSTFLWKNLWPFLYYFGGPFKSQQGPCWLSAQAVQECIENQPANSYEKSVA